MNELSLIVILLLLAISIITLFQKLGIPSVLGYLCIGLAVGPSGFNLIDSIEDIQHLAELGIVFLLFKIGLEISLPRLMAMKKNLLVIGGLQVVLCALIPGFFAWVLGMTLQGALVASAAVALSSTAIVLRELTSRQEFHTQYGQLAFSILLFQDIAAVPFLIVIPILGDVNTQMLSSVLLSTLLKGIIIVIIFVIIGKYLIRPCFKLIATTKSTELFMLMALLVVFGAALLTRSAGLSMVLGAFLGGIILSETEYRHQLESDINPFKDVLLGLFFITVGMMLDISIVIENWYWVIFLVVAIITFKTCVIACIAKWVGKLGTASSLRVGLILAHSGEFAFALLALAMSTQVLQIDYGQVILAGVIITMFISPFMIQYSPILLKYIPFLKSTDATINPLFQKLENVIHQNHIIIAGFGRMGQTVALFLKQEKIPYLAIDNDIYCVSQAVTVDEPVYYGDATTKNVLISAGINSARLLVVCIDDANATELVITVVKSLKKDLPILVRTKDETQIPALRSLGITEVVPELLEASLTFSGKLLRILGLNQQEIDKKLMWAREASYYRIRGSFEGEIDTALDTSKHKILRTLVIPIDAKCIGRPLSEIVFSKYDVELRAVHRKDDPQLLLSPDIKLRSNDVLVLYGDNESLLTIEKDILL